LRSSVRGTVPAGSNLTAIVLGVFWLAEGALQLQPFMFGRGFANQILMPGYMGSPARVTGPALAFTRLVLHAPAAWNAAFAVTQLLLGAALLWRPAVLAGSVGQFRVLHAPGWSPGRRMRCGPRSRAWRPANPGGSPPWTVASPARGPAGRRPRHGPGAGAAGRGVLAAAPPPGRPVSLDQVMLRSWRRRK
jgi:hypothetical protein